MAYQYFFKSFSDGTLDSVTSGTNAGSIPDGGDCEVIFKTGAGWTKATALYAIEAIRNAILTGGELS
jgi:hypothetical protein